MAIALESYDINYCLKENSLVENVVAGIAK